MNSYRYIKVLPVTITVPVIPFISVTLGILLLIWVAAPILSFSILYAASGTTLTPLAEDVRAEVPANETVDFSKASNWFPKNPAKKVVAPMDTYTISIPKLRIDKAMVKIGSDDLSKNLIHYGDSALPGKEGTAVLFGHSVLPSFYDPKNYLTIFSLLPTLTEGDDIFVRYDGVDYRYEVVEKIITTPNDVSGLEQVYDNSYLTLVTCVPPGTYLERMWVTGKLKPYGS